MAEIEFPEDVRWKQRLDSYRKSLAILQIAFASTQLDVVRELGILHAFLMSVEQGIETLRDYLDASGELESKGSRDVIRLAFKRGMLTKGEVWMKMIEDRNRVVHGYLPNTMQDILSSISTDYQERFQELLSTLTKYENQ